MEPIDATAPRPIDDRVKHPSIWMDEISHDEIAWCEKLRKLIETGDTVNALGLVETKKHYWAGIRDGNRFMRNPFKQEVQC